MAQLVKGTDEVDGAEPSQYVPRGSLLSHYDDNDDEEKEKWTEEDRSSVPSPLMKAEAILSKRTGRIALVLEAFYDAVNQQAVLRTAEGLGLQFIYIVNTAQPQKRSKQQLKLRKKYKRKKLFQHRIEQQQPQLQSIPPIAVCPQLRTATASRTAANVVADHPASPLDCPRLPIPSASTSWPSRNSATTYFTTGVTSDNKPTSSSSSSGVKKSHSFTSSSKCIAKGADLWLDIVEFDSTSNCIQALKAEGWEIWATDLAAGADVLDVARNKDAFINFPRKLALVIGKESTGVTAEMLTACDRRVYLPMSGWTGSFNLGIATAMILQSLLILCPDAQGDLSSEQRDAIRHKWYSNLAKTPAQLALYQYWLKHTDVVMAQLEQDEKESSMRQLRAPHLGATSIATPLVASPVDSVK